VKPEGAAFDDVGRGVEEGVSNVASPSEDAATRSLEVLKQISSTGYLRKRMPQELVVLQGGAGAADLGARRRRRCRDGHVIEHDDVHRYLCPR